MSLVTLPILNPLLFAILGILTWRHPRLQRGLGVVGMALQVGIAVWLFMRVLENGVQAVSLGGWQAPYGIALAADMFSTLMIGISALVGFLVVIYSIPMMDESRVNFGFYGFVHLLFFGINGAFLTTDLFNLFVWFEVTLISSFVLMALGSERAQMEGAVKYVIINLFASAMFLSALGILYGKTGTLNMADLALKIGESGYMEKELLTLTGMLFLVAFGIKSGLFPLFFWLPASYHTPPIPVTALFSALLTKMGMYSLIRVYTIVFDVTEPFTNHLLLVVAALTMLTGVLGAVAQYDTRRLLSFHIISQIGYAVMGLALATTLGIAGAIYFLLHNILAKTNLFLVAGVGERLRGSYWLKHIGGLYRTAPWLAVFFMISAFSLAGFPPLSGFFGKYALIKAGLEEAVQGKSYLLFIVVFTALGVGILTLFSMTKIFAEAFWKKQPDAEEAHLPPDGMPEPPGLPTSSVGKACLYVPIAMMALGTIMLGVLAEPALQICLRAAEELLNKDAYIQAVLNLQ